MLLATIGTLLVAIGFALGRARRKRFGLGFALLLVAVVVLVGALTFVPALALGPIVEHLNLIAAK